MGRQPSCGAREKILEAAFHLFTERGYRQAGVREISRIAGVATGGLYPHFGSKEQLYVEVLREEMRQYNTRMAQCKNAPPPIAIRRYVETHLDYLASKKEIVTRQFKDYDLPFVRPVAKQFFLRQKGLLEYIIRKGVERKLFVVADCGEAALFVLSLLKGLLFYNVAGTVEPQCSADTVCRMVLGFLGSTEAPGPSDGVRQG